MLDARKKSTALPALVLTAVLLAAGRLAAEPPSANPGAPAPSAPAAGSDAPAAPRPGPGAAAPPSAFEAEPALPPEGNPSTPAPGRKSASENFDPATYAAGVALVLLLLAACAGFARAWARKAGGAASPAIRPLARRSIAPDASVCLVEVGRKVLRVGLHRGGMVYLGEVSEPEEVALLRSQCVEGTRGEPFGKTLQEAVAAAEQAPAPRLRHEERMAELRAELARMHESITGMRGRVRTDAGSDADADAGDREQEPAGSGRGFASDVLLAVASTVPVAVGGQEVEA
ncbi:MAG: flagellar biosynthetic protein FliO [Planctomycetes bacterium]|nr:flagellar biosynthetic protein FliO [Planctomycetota bacterium]